MREKEISSHDKNISSKKSNEKEDLSVVPQNVKPPEKRKMVKGIFRNIECPGTMISFPFRAYKEPIKRYDLMDGGEYELPVEVVEHLNKNCVYKVPSWKAIEKGEIKPQSTSDWKKEITKVISRFSFQPLEYVGSSEEAI
jgi:hypothetical protein